MTEEQIKKIKTRIKELLDKMTLEARVEVFENSDGYKFMIKTLEGGLLIGENGKTFISLNHLIKKIIDKQFQGQEDLIFSLDINDYQLKKIEDLKNLARLNAQRVRYFKKEVILRAMTSFERRIIHSALSDCPDIITESLGETPNRQVVIKPYPQENF